MGPGPRPGPALGWAASASGTGEAGLPFFGASALDAYRLGGLFPPQGSARRSRWSSARCSCGSSRMSGYGLSPPIKLLTSAPGGSNEVVLITCRNKFRSCTGKAPLFALPWLQGVFLAPGARVHLTLPRPTGAQASGRQAITSSSDPAPLGVLQASATKNASGLPSNFCLVPSRLRSVSAPDRPSSTNRCRVRWT